MLVQPRTNTERRKSRQAVTALEYALIVAAIALVIGSSTLVLGSHLNRTFDQLWDLMRQSYSYRRG
ncbi:MAG TPA: Flp family type IVb pilin [Acetobacteraceae bacterium]|nr:Flp family type IVb pilin [Acetobacteraceae bacterium]